MPEEKMEEISEDLLDGSSKGGGAFFKKIPVLIFGIIIMIILSYLLVIKVIKPMLTEDKTAKVKKVEELKPKDNPKEVIQKTDQGDEIPTEEKTEIQEIYTFPETFEINPLVRDEMDDISILLVSISLELDNSDVISEIEKRTPQLRDLINTMFSSKPLRELIKPETKIRMKNDIQKELNKILIKGKVVNVYFQKYQFQIL